MHAESLISSWIVRAESLRCLNMIVRPTNYCTRGCSSHTLTLPTVASVDKDKRTILEEVKNRQASELASVQQENETLRQKMLNIEADLAGQRELLQNHQVNNNRLVNEADKAEILRTFNSIKEAVSRSPAKTTQEFEKNVAELGEMVIRSNAALAKSEEVFKNSTRSSQPIPVKSIVLPQPQPSSKQQTTKPNLQSFASKIAQRFTPSKADTKTPNVAPREAERRNSRTASLARKPNPSRTAQLSSPTK